MAKLRQFNGSDTWSSDIYFPAHPESGKDGRLRKALHTDKRLAEEKLGDLVKQRNAAKFGHMAPDTSWESFKTRFLGLYKKKAENTYLHYKGTIDRIESAAPVPIRKLDEVTPALLEKLQADWIDAGRKKYAILKNIKNVKSMMRKAESWRLVPPADWKQIKNGKVPRGRLVFWTIEELQRLLNIAPGLHKTAFFLGSRAGFRPAEQFHATLDSVQLGINRISVHSVECWRCPKRAHRPGLWEPKDKEERSIPIEPDLRAHLEAILPTLPGPWVVARQDGTTPTYYGFLQFVKRYVRRAGLKGSAYTGRHTFASHLIQQGLDRQTLREYLGHDSIEMGEIYTHLMPQIFDQGVNRLAPLKLKAIAPGNETGNGSSKMVSPRGNLDGDSISHRESPKNVIIDGIAEHPQEEPGIVSQ